MDEKIHNENPYGDVYKNEKTIPYVAVENLGNEIIEKSKNENDGFKKEYATLLYGERYPRNVAKRPENIPRNRFKTTFPYDHSRVVLVRTNTDYINANYIDGLNREKQYIAAQGPKPNTVSDFWCMAWQEDVNQIIMLTNLKEGRKSYGIRITECIIVRRTNSWIRKSCTTSAYLGAICMARQE